MIEILITAFLSAGIAFLQNFLTGFLHNQNLDTNIASAGVIGGAISALRNFRFC